MSDEELIERLRAALKAWDGYGGELSNAEVVDQACEMAEAFQPLLAAIRTPKDIRNRALEEAAARAKAKAVFFRQQTASCDSGSAALRLLEEKAISLDVFGDELRSLKDHPSEG